MTYIVPIRFDTESLVELLVKHATDWTTTLDFIEKLAEEKSIKVDRKEIEIQVRLKLLGVEEF